MTKIVHNKDKKVVYVLYMHCNQTIEYLRQFSIPFFTCVRVSIHARSHPY
jgi:hypothetical protein